MISEAKVAPMISFAIGTIVVFSEDLVASTDDLPEANAAGEFIVTNVSLNGEGIEYAVNGDWGFSRSDLDFVGEATEATIEYAIGVEVGDDSGEDDEDTDEDSEYEEDESAYEDDGEEDDDYEE